MELEWNEENNEQIMLWFNTNIVYGLNSQIVIYKAGKYSLINESFGTVDSLMQYIDSLDSKNGILCSLNKYDATIMVNGSNWSYKADPNCGGTDYTLIRFMLTEDNERKIVPLTDVVDILLDTEQLFVATVRKDVSIEDIFCTGILSPNDFAFTIKKCNKYTEYHKDNTTWSVELGYSSTMCLSAGTEEKIAAIRNMSKYHMLR